MISAAIANAGVRGGFGEADNAPNSPGATDCIRNAGHIFLEAGRFKSQRHLALGEGPPATSKAIPGFQFLRPPYVNDQISEALTLARTADFLRMQC